jgi:hypothetical protein
MAAEQFIRPEIIFVFIRVHSWLKTFRPSGGAPQNPLAPVIIKDHQRREWRNLYSPVAAATIEWDSQEQ